jgi:hypothetical protein
MSARRAGGGRWFVAAAIGSVVSLLLGSGLLAVLSDSVTSTGNEAASGEYDFTHDLQAVTIPAGDTCNSSTEVFDGPIPGVINGGEAGAFQVDLNSTTGDEFGTSAAVCVVNTGTHTGRVMMEFASVSDLERGGCTATEIDPGGDTSCDDTGELEPVLHSGITDAGAAGITSSSSSCSTGTDRVEFGWVRVFGVVVDEDLAPGEGCAVIIRFGVNPDVTNPQPRLVAQTDQVTFDIVFTLEDATP